METELIGEFKGKNTSYRVLPDGKLETSSQGTGKILGTEAFVLSTAVGSMANGVFMGETTSIITTKDGDALMMKGTAVGYPSGNGGTTRAATIQMTQAQKLIQLKKTVCLQEFETDMTDNWTGKIWQWK